VLFSPAPEPGSPSGKPAGDVGPVVVPFAPDGTALIDSGLHSFQSRDVGELRFTSRFRRLLNLQAGQALQDYLGTLFATMPLSNFDDEQYWPEDQFFSGVTQSISAGGQIGQGVLFNPAGSKVLIVVRSLFVVNSVADTVTLRYGNAALGATANSALDDTRGGVTVASPPASRLSTQVGAATGGGAGLAFEFYPLPAGAAPFKIEGPFILMPGVSLSLSNSTAGVATLTATWKWREKIGVLV